MRTGSMKTYVAHIDELILAASDDPGIVMLYELARGATLAAIEAEAKRQQAFTAAGITSLDQDERERIKLALAQSRANARALRKAAAGALPGNAPEDASDEAQDEASVIEAVIEAVNAPVIEALAGQGPDDDDADEVPLEPVPAQRRAGTSGKK